MSYAVAFTGHRDVREDLDLDYLREVIKKHLDGGCNLFYCGMAKGFDLICCSILASFKKDYTFKIIACIPYPSQANGYNRAEKEIYLEMNEFCDEKKIFSESYRKGATLERDRYMVDNSEVLIAYVREQSSGSGYTVGYAKVMRKKIEFVNRNIPFIFS